ncbi:MAG: BMP family ABC transporter substrate-binding protein [Devosia sp.]|uniref:BMP family lipoprotein n=1 Tax=Devosia sp. TaxID=1871048 RepID=UPI001ACF7561|nr:BMP family ABC transporter substrate-binding protein [Devosia sp.]MBN9315858.1 BMP family ABC transporter substrate-binding protein [Devosia sp.]
MSLISNFAKAAAGLLLAGSMMASTAIPAAAAEYTKDHPLKVALVLHGTLGDKSFFDSAKAGMDKAAAELPVEVKVIELGYDRSKWQAGLADATDSGYDVVIAGTFDMTAYIAELAPQYPDVKFIDFDDAPDYTKCDCKNVLAVQYGTSTAGYLAGYAAAKISKSGILGTILGMEFPTVTDFKVGFDQGAKDANPNIQILNATAGTFSDPAKGKEIGLAQLNQGADIIFPIAGGTGLGALQAVKEAGGGKLAVGVDSDQAAIFAVTDPAQADVIFTSVEKKVGESLYLALKGTIDGTQEYGKRIVLGLKDGAVGISKNAQYEKLVPADVRAEVDAKEAAIIAGEIVVAADVK